MRRSERRRRDAPRTDRQIADGLRSRAKDVRVDKDGILCIAFPSACHCSRKACGTRAAKEEAVQPACERNGAPATGPERARTAGWRGRRAGGGEGRREVSRPSPPPRIHGWTRHPTPDGQAGAEGRARRNAKRARANRGGERPRSRAAFARRSGAQSGRTRRQSHDWRAVRTGCGTPSARGEARLGRSPPHADRHSPYRTLRTQHNVRQGRAQGSSHLPVIAHVRRAERAPQKSDRAISAQGTGRRGGERESARTAGRARRRRGGCGRDGRYSDQALRAVSGGCMARA